MREARFTLSLADQRATSAFGYRLGQLGRPADLIMLIGDLGAGKTTLTQSIARGMGVADEYYVTSPSFNLLHEYPGRLPLYHMDCYRLGDEDDVEGAGLAEYLCSDGVTVVEWPDRLGSLVPEQRLEISLTVAADEPDAREVELIAYGSIWEDRWRQLISNAGAWQGEHCDP